MVITRDVHGLKAGDVLDFIKYHGDDNAMICDDKHRYYVDLKDIKSYYYTNSATIAGRTYQIPDEKVDQVKKLVDPGMPKWEELKYIQPCAAYLKLLLAADYVNEGWKPDWKDERQNKYMLYYDGNEFLASRCWRFSHGVPVFYSSEAGIRAVELFRANGDYDELVRFYQS